MLTFSARTIAFTMHLDIYTFSKAGISIFLSICSTYGVLYYFRAHTLGKNPPLKKQGLTSEQLILKNEGFTKQKFRRFKRFKSCVSLKGCNK